MRQFLLVSALLAAVAAQGVNEKKFVTKFRATVTDFLEANTQKVTPYRRSHEAISTKFWGV